MSNTLHIDIALIRSVGEIADCGLMKARDALLSQNGDPYRALGALSVWGQAVRRTEEAWERIIAAKAAEYQIAFPDLAAADTPAAALSPDTDEPTAPGLG